MLKNKLKKSLLLSMASTAIILGSSSTSYAAQLVTERGAALAVGAVGDIVGNPFGSISTAESGAATLLTTADASLRCPKGLYSIISLCNTTPAAANLTDAAAGAGAFSVTMQEDSILQLLMGNGNITLNNGTWTIPSKNGTLRLVAHVAAATANLGSASSTPFVEALLVELYGGPEVSSANGTALSKWVLMDGAQSSTGTGITTLGGSLKTKTGVSGKLLLNAATTTVSASIGLDFIGEITLGAATSFTGKVNAKNLVLQSAAFAPTFTQTGIIKSIVASGAPAAHTFSQDFTVDTLDLSGVTTSMTISPAKKLTIVNLIMPNAAGINVTFSSGTTTVKNYTIGGGSIVSGTGATVNY